MGQESTYEPKEPKWLSDEASPVCEAYSSDDDAPDASVVPLSLRRKKKKKRVVRAVDETMAGDKHLIELIQDTLGKDYFCVARMR